MRLQTSTNRLSSKGFTLVELLVVVAIIALLLGILLPALGKARKMAEGVKCLTQTKQLAQAGFLYAQDNEGHWCSHVYWGRSDFDHEEAENLIPYLGLDTDDSDDNKDATIFTCPTAEKIKPSAESSGFARTLTMNFYSAWDYINNPKFPNAWKNTTGEKLTTVKRPSEHSYFMDGIALFEMPEGDWYYESAVRWNEGGREQSLWKAVDTEEVVYPHGNESMWSVSFVDLHGEHVDRKFLEETIPEAVPELPDAHPFWGDTRPGNDYYE